VVSNMLVDRRIFGFSMNRRRNRRWLVVSLCICIAALCVMVFLNRVSGMAMFLTIIVVINPFVFGEFMFWGKKRGGILKPFEPTFEPTSEQANDERELGARDLAHFHAYRRITMLLVCIAVLPEYLSRKHVSLAELLPLTQKLLWVLVAIALTLPQAMLLWSEPDIETESEISSLATLKGSK